MALGPVIPAQNLLVTISTNLLNRNDYEIPL